MTPAERIKLIREKPSSIVKFIIDEWQSDAAHKIRVPIQTLYTLHWIMDSYERGRGNPFHTEDEEYISEHSGSGEGKDPI